MGWMTKSVDWAESSHHQAVLCFSSQKGNGIVRINNRSGPPIYFSQGEKMEHCKLGEGSRFKATKKKGNWEKIN
jgi:hypothetical protein